ncbi:MAG: choice-of-anchor J domain-containing protein [Bacteroidota bacterium]
MNYIIKLMLTVSLFLGLSFSATAQLNEGFEGAFPPAGWAILDNGVQQNQSWEKATQNPNTGSAHAFVNFSSSTTELAEDWLVTPKIKPTTGNTTLTFQVTNDFSGNDGSTYSIRVSTTSQSDFSSFAVDTTFTEADFTANTYKAFSVDLVEYIDQEIFVAFVLSNSKGDSWLLDDVSGPAAVAFSEAPDCNADLIQPDPLTWNAVPVSSMLGWSPATGGPTGYKLSIGTSQGSTDFLALTDIGNVTTYQPMSNFAFDTRYYVTIVAYNGNGDGMDCQEIEFTTEASTSSSLDCTTTTTENRTVCYGNNATESFSLSSGNGNQVNLKFTTGTVENNQDSIKIYDGTDNTGRLLNDGNFFGNNGDLKNLSFTSTSSNLFVEIISDGSNSCRTGEQTQIAYTATCTNCVPPIATVAAGMCDVNDSEFFINLTTTSLGNGTLTLYNTQNATQQTIASTGTIPVGPFNFGAAELLLYNSNTECIVKLPPVSVTGCTPANDDCTSAAALSLSPDNTCANKVSGTTTAATASAETGLCTANALDVWYSFTAASTAKHTFELSNAVGIPSVAVYSGTCVGLTLVGECVNNLRTNVDLTSGQTYLVQVSTDDAQTAGTFDLCAYATPAAPANDLCANATAIPCPAGLTSTGIDATFATNTGATTCNSNPVGAGVWYQLTGSGGLLNVTVNPNEWDAEIQLWSGANCNSLTCVSNTDVEGTNAAEMITNFQTMASTTYYLYVGASSIGGLTGTFDLTVTCPEPPMATINCLDNPVNDPCNNISIAGVGEVQQDVTACQTIETTTSVVTIESGQNVTFKAGTSITMKAGFSVKAGATFRAHIEGCAAPVTSSEGKKASE